jgi:FAD:protein FMN transferase
MSAPKLARRRVITIAAAAAGLALLPVPLRRLAAPPPGLLKWRGRALGADAAIVLRHPDRARAEKLIALAVAEIERLEDQFSLYRAHSALRRLNRSGVLAQPSFDMLRLLATSRRYSDLSGGAFDVTVQPLWKLHAAHFARPDADPEGPPRRAVEAALGLVDYRAMNLGSSAVSLGRPGMALTLNGIAQGYITDSVAELLRGHGMERVLIDLGEIRALGRVSDRPWRIALNHAGGPVASLPRTLELTDGAVATSTGPGTPIGPGGRHHLFDPRTGGNPRHWTAVTVVAASATAADALSTALYGMVPEEAARLVSELDGVGAFLTRADGRTVTLGNFNHANENWI